MRRWWKQRRTRLLPYGSPSAKQRDDAAYWRDQVTKAEAAIIRADERKRLISTYGGSASMGAIEAELRWKIAQEVRCDGCIEWAPGLGQCSSCQRIAERIRRSE